MSFQAIRYAAIRAWMVGGFPFNSSSLNSVNRNLVSPCQPTVPRKCKDPCHPKPSLTKSPFPNSAFVFVFSCWSSACFALSFLSAAFCCFWCLQHTRGECARSANAIDWTWAKLGWLPKCHTKPAENPQDWPRVWRCQRRWPRFSSGISRCHFAPLSGCQETYWCRLIADCWAGSWDVS